MVAVFVLLVIAMAFVIFAMVMAEKSRYFISGIFGAFGVIAWLLALLRMYSEFYI